MLFTYSIVPKGRGEANALVQGNLSAPTLKAAKWYLQTMTAPNVSGRRDLEVILTDAQGKEVWRGPHKG